MAFVNLPANLQDMFNGIYDRLAKLETGPNQAMTTAVIADTRAIQALNEASQALAQATQAYNVGAQSLIKSADTITNANNQITGINSNGITVYSGASASTGARVLMNSLGIVAYNSSNNPTFSLSSSNGAFSTTGAIFTSSTISGGSLNINGNCIIDSSGYLTATGATITGTIYASAGTFAGTVTASAGAIGGFNIGSNYLSTVNSASGYRWNSATGGMVVSTLTASDTITAQTGIVISTGGGNLSMGGNNINNFGTASGTTVNTSGNISATGTITATGDLYALQAQTATTTANTNCYITTSGQIRRTSTTSSQRYKENITDIQNVPGLNPKALLDLPVRAFTYIEGHIPDTDDRYMQMLPGFIAEEVDAIYPIAVDYENGPETWNPFLIIPGLLALIQDQEQRIQALEGNA